MLTGKLHWYITIWRNKDFLRTRYRPYKVGSIIATKERYENNMRVGLNNKTRNFEAVNKMVKIFHGTKKEFKDWYDCTDT